MDSDKPFSVFFRYLYILWLNPDNFSVTPGCEWITHSLVLQQGLPNSSGKSPVHSFPVVKELADVFLHCLLHHALALLSLAHISGSCTSLSTPPLPMAIKRGPNTAELS